MQRRAPLIIGLCFAATAAIGVTDSNSLHLYGHPEATHGFPAPGKQPETEARRLAADVFAGAYESEGQIFLGFTQDVKKNLRRVQQSIGRAPVLRGFHAEYTEAALEQVASRVWREPGPDARRAFTIVSSGIDVPRNRVTVGVEGDRRAAESALRERFGSAVEVRAEEPPQPA